MTDQANTTVSDERAMEVADAVDDMADNLGLAKGYVLNLKTAAKMLRRRATADVTEAQVRAIAKLYGNYIEGHGWTGFGPTPDQILAALTPPMGR